MSRKVKFFFGIGQQENQYWRGKFNSSAANYFALEGFPAYSYL